MNTKDIQELVKSKKFKDLYEERKVNMIKEEKRFAFKNKSV